MVTSYIGLGSNMGDRQKNITLALTLLKQDPAVKIIQTSSLIETDPVGGPPQGKFLNGAAKLETSYTAAQLLKKLQEIEVKLGREKNHLKYHPRTIDLDILTFGDSNIDTKDLKVPHPRMREREFVMTPLREIAPSSLFFAR